MTSKRTALITGCSDGGIGHALALELHEGGVRVFATARTLSSMEKLKEKGIEVFKLDVTVHSSVQNVKAEVEKLTGGTLDMLVNNAGVFYESTAIEDNMSKIKDMYAVNVFGVMEVSQAFLPLVVEASKAHITSKSPSWNPRVVQMSSLAAICPTPFYSAYNSSKAAMLQYGNTLRVELAPLGVKVITVHVGRVNTRIIRDIDYKGLPEGSLYTPLKDIYEGVAHEVFPKGALSCQDFAKATATHLLKKNANPFFWYGGSSLMMWFLDAFFPRTIWDSFVRKTFSLNKLGDAFRKDVLAKKTV
ncbi:hypothetical protein EUX98_g2695 [Antrodiella citrinella]|uniref:Uncharacterized protein n=1 Tax=Antrodiella citrinella TaxID=2447956 RepID=A0A4S4N0I7_9APHY|nr:hypothetical protein EUX98_g2695 [Antrodiella citrinella]